ncbi:hypothetical protein NQ314_012881 [Rhamnusium bicolor]|uniref:Nuclease HARBI1 n=1 Tax=Rhamnusium bicolor TaxID=1586634 RepID=A0AAV8X942_9CUCU|nr:hypothetical protein NQ314_012881 [Rhamnusium bicolor]
MYAICKELVNRLRRDFPNADSGIVEYEKKVLVTIWMLAKQERVSDNNQVDTLNKYMLHFRHVILGNPGIIGAVDGCHIPIKAPVGNSIDYNNRNNYHSVILQATYMSRIDMVPIVITAACVLHNFILKHEGAINDNDYDNDVLHVMWNEDNHEEELGRAHNIGAQKRDYIASILL